MTKFVEVCHLIKSLVMKSRKKQNLFETPAGTLKVQHLAHFSLFLEWNGVKVYADPYSDLYDFSGMEKADLILLTHAHTDHYDCKAIAGLVTEKTEFVVSKAVGWILNGEVEKADPSTNRSNMYEEVPVTKRCRVTVLENGESAVVRGIEITATPAYNIENFRDNGNPYHIKGEGNGYLLNFGGFKVYIAGDTEIIPEMALFKGADILFLPKNMPYTLSDEKFIEAANMLHPKNLYPVHYFQIEPQSLLEGISDDITLYVDGVAYTK